MVDLRILSAKVSQIEKCLRRVTEKRTVTLQDFLRDADRQDIVIFNLVQAIQGCIDMAAHVVSDEGLGVAGSTSEIFYLLLDHGIISLELTDKMSKAVGFRNLCTHEYTKLDLEKVYDFAQKDLADMEEFIRAVVVRYSNR